MSISEKLGKYTPRPVAPAPGDLYIAPQGNDENDGSFERPFASFERAMRAVRERRNRNLGTTVCVRAGEYFTAGLRFTEKDGGTRDCPVVFRAYGDGEVVLNGGASLNPADFKPVDEAVRARLHGEAKDAVVAVNLRDYGLKPSDWGPVYAIGAFGTEMKYDGDTVGLNCEVFFNDKRMTLARYPNGNEFLKIHAVHDVGDVHEFPEQNYYPDWDNRRNHWGGVYLMDKPTTARVEGWASYKDVWAFGYFYHDWADGSTPIDRFDCEHRRIYPKYASRYGCRAGALYYFYNVLDELDEPGEWYLDRESGMLYIYPTAAMDGARIEMTLTRQPVISGEGVNHLTLEGFTLKGTRADALSIEGNDNVVRRCRVLNVLGNAICMKGYRNLVTECDISHTGKGGIVIDGGETETLTPGESRADNNVIHDWSEVFLTYTPGVFLKGVGNVCSHNEMYNSPHAAIFYYGNDHLVEYNYIHEVVLQSSDAGAIYSGQYWSMQGCVVRYNCLENIGGPDFRPDGIYFDDALSGQTAYGNLLINVHKNGFLIGGGRDNKVWGNVVVNAGWGITYDDRLRDGLLNNGWAVKAVNNYETSCMWVRLRESPYQTPLWKERYPSLANISHDFSQPDDPNFAPNPSFNEVHDNIVIDQNSSVGRFADSVVRFGSVKDNFAYATAEEAGFDEAYQLKPGARALADDPNFVNIPVEKIGRY